MRGFVCALLALGAAACGGGGGGAGDALDAVTPVQAPDFPAADLVFGQAGFTGQDQNRGTSKADADALHMPGMVGADPSGHGLFFVPDVGNNRVLGFFEVPIFNNIAANFVLGQPGFGFTGPGTAAVALHAPVCAFATFERLYVTDHGNHRIAIWEGLPITGGTPMSRVLGQPDAITGMPGAGAAGLNGPTGMCAHGERIVVADTGNHRVLVWHTHPEVDGAPADLVLGQATFDGVQRNRGLFPGAHTLNEPTAVWTNGERLVVVDRGNHRVLVWLTFPETDGAPADLVLGQTDFQQIAAGTGAAGLRDPSDVDSDGGRLLIADAGNNRILSWHEFPTVTGTPADGVLGQSDFLHTAPNDDDQDGVQDPIPSARTFSSSASRFLGVRWQGSNLFVADSGNHRVLIFHDD